MDFFARCKSATKAISRAQVARERQEAALAAALEAETSAWADLYRIPGVTAETAAQITGHPAQVCRAQADAVKARTRG